MTAIFVENEKANTSKSLKSLKKAVLFIIRKTR